MKRSYEQNPEEGEKTLIIPKKNYYRNIKGVGKELELRKGKVYDGTLINKWGSDKLQIVNEQGVITNYYETSKFIYGTSRVREIRLSKVLS